MKTYREAVREVFVTLRRWDDLSRQPDRRGVLTIKRYFDLEVEKFLAVALYLRYPA